jgi:hypothetical protein
MASAATSSVAKVNTASVAIEIIMLSASAMVGSGMKRLALLSTMLMVEGRCGCMSSDVYDGSTCQSYFLFHQN